MLGLQSRESIVSESNIGEKLTFEFRDEFQRKPIAENVIKLLTSEIDVSPMVIDGAFGIGKTEFCFKLINLFKEEQPEYKVVYVNAFKADHADEPILTILAAILEILPPEGDVKQSFIKKALPVARFGLKVAGKAGISWVLRQDADQIGDEFEKDLKTAGDEVINATVEALLKDHEKISQNITILKSALEQVASENQIVIFIDELDRCRPDFAVAMLEGIKHIFDVQNVQFILAANNEQLKVSVSHRYGKAIDSTKYLDKFFGFSFFLSNTFYRNGNVSANAAEEHFRRSVSDSSNLNGNFNFQGEVMDAAIVLISVNRLTLREVETFVRYLEVYVLLTEGGGLKAYPGYKIITLFAIFAFCFSKELAHNILNKSIDIDEIARVLGKTYVYNPKDQGRYQDHFDMLIALFLLNGRSLSKTFQLEDEELRQWWVGQMNTYFRNGLGLQHDDITEYVRDVIQELKLGLMTK